MSKSTHTERPVRAYNRPKQQQVSPGSQSPCPSLCCDTEDSWHAHAMWVAVRPVAQRRSASGYPTPLQAPVGLHTHECWL